MIDLPLKQMNVQPMLLTARQAAADWLISSVLVALIWPRDPDRCRLIGKLADEIDFTYPPRTWLACVEACPLSWSPSRTRLHSQSPGEDQGPSSHRRFRQGTFRLE